MKVVVIGSGLGGMSCAALLSKNGNDVRLLERNSFVGGRCAGFERDRFVYDFGVHMFSRGPSGPFGEVNRRVGGDLKWVLKDPNCRVIVGENEFLMPLDIKPLPNLYRFARGVGVKPSKFLGGFRLITALLKGREVEANDRISARDFLYRYTDDSQLHMFINCVVQLFFAIPYDQASAGEFIWCFSKMFQDATFGYPKGGAREIPLSLMRAFERAGGKISLDTPAQRIVIENKEVKGVQTPEGFLEADVVISNAGIKKTIELAGKENFNKEYVERAFFLRESYPYSVIKYALDKEVVRAPVVLAVPDIPADDAFRYLEEGSVPEDPYLFMPIPTNWDPGLAPEGKQLIIAGTASPKDIKNSELCHKVLDRVDQKVKNLYPEIRKHIIWEMRTLSKDVSNLTGRGTGEAIGLAQAYDQCGTNKPSPAMPIKSLFLVGCDAGARGIGTEQAVGSGIHVSKLVSKAREEEQWE